LLAPFILEASAGGDAIQHPGRADQFWSTSEAHLLSAARVFD
jgi:hypothetical protein